MMAQKRCGALAVVVCLLAAGASPAAVAAKPKPAAGAAGRPAPAMLPERLIECTLGRITNFDPDKNQSVADFKFEGRHRFSLFLPAIPARTAPPPQSTEPPEPIHPDTRIVSDPDGLARGARLGFNRVVDDWPRRVEMTAPISDVAVNLIVVDQINEGRQTAGLFLTRANDAVTFDHQHLYSGQCKVRVTPAGQTAAATPPR